MKLGWLRACVVERGVSLSKRGRDDYRGGNIAEMLPVFYGANLYA